VLQKDSSVQETHSQHKFVRSGLDPAPQHTSHAMPNNNIHPAASVLRSRSGSGRCNAGAAAGSTSTLFGQPAIAGLTGAAALKGVRSRAVYRSRPEEELEEVRDWTGLGMVWCGVFRASLDAAAFECAASRSRPSSTHLPPLRPAARFH